MAKTKTTILSIAHVAVEQSAGRLRYHPFADYPDLDVHLVAPKRWTQFGRRMIADPANDPGVTMHIEPAWFVPGGPASWYLHIYPRLRRLIRQTRPDVIHLWEEPWSAVALQAGLLKGEAALVLEVDQNISKRLPPPFETMRRRVLAQTDHVLSRSPDATMVVRASGYTGPVSEIGYGVDFTTFHARPRQAPGVGLKLGYVGRLVVEKGLDDALDALAQTPDDVELRIMGEGPHEQALRNRISALGLSNRVTIRGWGTPAAVADFIHDLDVMVLLTRTTNAVKEQFGRVIIEAQACGVPVIGSTCGAIPSIVADGGWIVPESDPAALAALVRRLRVNPEEIARAGRAGLQNVERRFTYEAVAGQLADGWLAAKNARQR